MLAQFIPDDFDLKALAQEALPSFVRAFGIVLVFLILLFVAGLFISDETDSGADLGLASEVVAIDFDEGADAPAEVIETTDFEVPVVSGVSLPKAPIADVSEEFDDGILPKTSDDGLKPFQAYRRSVVLPAAGVPVVAIGVLDYGLSDRASRRALQDFGAEVSFLMSPYADDAQGWMDMARRGGHEVWLQAPFETEDYPLVDSGPLTLLKRSSLRLNQDRLKKLMSTVAGYAGLWGRVDGTFDGADTLVNGFFDSVYGRGLGYLEIGSGYNSTIEGLSLSYNLPYLRPSIVVSGDQTAQGYALRTLLETAKGFGRGIGVFAPTPVILDQLPDWIDMMEQEGVVVVPISAIYDRAAKK